MLNQDLMDEKEQEIARLRLAIEAFKKYDAKRKVYISKLEEDLEIYSAKYVELKNESELSRDELIQKLLKRIDNQRVELRRLSNIVNLIEKSDPEIMKMFQNTEIADILTQNILIKERNKILKKEINNLRETIERLICRLNQAEQH